MLDVFLEDWALDRFRSIDRLTAGNTDKTTWQLVDREEEGKMKMNSEERMMLENN